MYSLLTEYTSVWSWEQSLALGSLSPAAKDLILSASKELFRALKADNLRNNISVDFPGCSWESAKEEVHPHNTSSYAGEETGSRLPTEKQQVKQKGC